jgi:transcription antitermination factor NusG
VVTDAPYWCVARSEPNRESVAAHFLGLAGYVTYLPRIREMRSNHGRRVVTTPALFPNYLFVHVATGRWWDARWGIGIASLIMSGDQPARVSDCVISDLKNREQDGFVTLDEPPGLRLGGKVKLIAGPLTGHLGLYAGQRGPERVAVLLALFGSQRPAIVSLSAVERA